MESFGSARLASVATISEPGSLTRGDAKDELFDYLFKEKQFANVPSAEDFPEQMFKNIEAYDDGEEPYYSLSG